MMIAALRQMHEGDEARHVVGELQPHHLGIEPAQALGIGRLQQHMAQSHRPHLVARRTAAAAHEIVAGIVDDERFRAAPRLRLFGADIKRMAIGVSEPQPAAEIVARRVDLGHGTRFHARADRGHPGLVAAEAQMVQALLRALDEQHLVLFAPVAAERQRGAAVLRR